jgi:hypothetical protein
MMLRLGRQRKNRLLFQDANEAIREAGGKRIRRANLCDAS